MKIAVDCRWIDASGIGVYIRECLPYFLDSGNFFLLLGNTDRLKTMISGRQNVEIINCPVRPFTLQELIAFPQNLHKKINCCDLYYSPYFNIPGSVKIPIYTTIHDMIFPDMPELSSRLGIAARMWFYHRAFRLSRKIFTVSGFSKSRIEHYSGNKVPVIVTHSAIQPGFLEKKEYTKKKTIVFIGNIKKHKGLSILIEAFQKAKQHGLIYKLIIVGSRENFRSFDMDFSSNFDSDSIEFTGFISDEKLRNLLGEASLLVQPSLYEGFCLPPLEALVCGTPALISDIPVLREVYKEFPEKELGTEFPVYWFKSGDVNDLEQKLLFLLQDKKNTLIELPDKLKNLYTFKKTALSILNSMET